MSKAANHRHDLARIYAPVSLLLLDRLRGHPCAINCAATKGEGVSRSGSEPFPTACHQLSRYEAQIEQHDPRLCQWNMSTKSESDGKERYSRQYKTDVIDLHK